jgi:Flp pilus assembly protein TadB
MVASAFILIAAAYFLWKQCEKKQTTTTTTTSDSKSVTDTIQLLQQQILHNEPQLLKQMKTLT